MYWIKTKELSVFDKIKNHYQENLPFVVYRKPNETKVSGFFMTNNKLIYTTNFSESGFVFAPFDDEKSAVLFPLEEANLCQEEVKLPNFKTLENSFKVDESSKDSHIKIVEKAIDEININELDKVVLSRKEEVVLKNFDIISIYSQLLQRYKNAFVYAWYHPKIGFWIGATPEILLELKNSDFKTMSLAGTQNFEEGKEIIWGKKELEEQEIVTQFIKHQLIGISTDLNVDATETFRAGSLLHLRTKVEGKLLENETLKKLIKALHPTPAVCGFPRKKAKEFILKNENYDREFYTGFLGELNVKTKSSDGRKSHLFVNLRCASIKNKIASIYVGGGITKDSIAKKEWQETVNKTATIKVVLNKKP